MNHSVKLAALAMAAAVTAAHAQVKFDANIEADPTYKGSQGTTKSSTFMGGRVEINANAELARNGDNFVRAKGTLIVPLSRTTDLTKGENNEVSVDDAWIQFGNAAADLKLGRQEAADLFPMGKDVIAESAGGDIGYRANKLRGRFKDGAIHFVAGLNAGSALRAELGVVSNNNGSAEFERGVRPTLVYSAGGLTLRAGIESYKTQGSATTTNGYGLSAGYALGQNSTVNLSYANSSDLDASSIGLNATFGPAGVGFVQDKDSAANRKFNTVYAAYSFPLMGIKGATITPAFSHSDGTGVDNLTAFRLRFNYAF